MTREGRFRCCLIRGRNRCSRRQPEPASEVSPLLPWPGPLPSGPGVPPPPPLSGKGESEGLGTTGRARYPGLWETTRENLLLSLDVPLLWVFGAPLEVFSLLSPSAGESLSLRFLVMTLLVMPPGSCFGGGSHASGGSLSLPSLSPEPEPLSQRHMVPPPPPPSKPVLGRRERRERGAKNHRQSQIPRAFGDDTRNLLVSVDVPLPWVFGVPLEVCSLFSPSPGESLMLRFLAMALLVMPPGSCSGFYAFPTYLGRGG